MSDLAKTKLSDQSSRYARVATRSDLAMPKLNLTRFALHMRGVHLTAKINMSAVGDTNANCNILYVFCD